MATAQPDSIAVAIIATIAVIAEALAAGLASTFTRTPVWWRREARTSLGEHIHEVPLLAGAHVTPARNLIAGAQATEAITRRAENTDIDAR
jgi:hypothetical protein